RLPVHHQRRRIPGRCCLGEISQRPHPRRLPRCTRLDARGWPASSPNFHPVYSLGDTAGLPKLPSRTRCPGSDRSGSAHPVGHPLVDSRGLPAAGVARDSRYGGTFRCAIALLSVASREPSPRPPLRFPAGSDRTGRPPPRHTSRNLSQNRNPRVGLAVPSRRAAGLPRRHPVPDRTLVLLSRAHRRAVGSCVKSFRLFLGSHLRGHSYWRKESPPVLIVRSRRGSSEAFALNVSTAE